MYPSGSLSQTVSRNLELLNYYTVVHLLNVSEMQYARTCINFYFKDTMRPEGIGLESDTMLSGQLRDGDPWNALTDEGSDW